MSSEPRKPNAEVFRTSENENGPFPNFGKSTPAFSEPRKTGNNRFRTSETEKEEGSDRRKRPHTHVVGVGGVGMNAVAQLLARDGFRVTGSDRFLDQGTRLPVLEGLERLGVELTPQDGSALTAETRRLVLSTAVEPDNPERVAAASLGIPEAHRAEILAGFASRGPLAAVAGTSGKTTCAGWLGWTLAACGLDPNLVNGGGVSGWGAAGLPGNVRRGPDAHWWVVEVDESDRSLLRFHPRIALINTITADHHPLEETVELFRAFARQVEETVVCGPGVRDLLRGDPGIRARLVDAGAPEESPLPGAHNRRNAASVKAMALACGADPAKVDAVLGEFPGVERRMERCSPRGAAAVYDDYAHNPEKIAAALRAARPARGRLFAVWRPHGFAPLRQNLEATADAFAANLRAEDEAWILPVFYAGGSAPRGVDAPDLVAAIRKRGATAKALDDYPETVPLRPEDALLVMGARDPALPVFARKIGQMNHE